LPIAAVYEQGRHFDRHRLFRALVPAILGRDVQTQKRDDAII
jgi:hypothetical protein